VPLTEREKQILDEIEANLHSEDPSFTRGIRQPWWANVRRVKLGAILTGVGFVTLLSAFAFNDWLVLMGVAAFVLMVLGIVLMSGATHDIARDRLRMHKVTTAEPLARSIRAKLASWDERLRERYRKKS
jgi:hypothetical protein